MPKHDTELLELAGKGHTRRRVASERKGVLGACGPHAYRLFVGFEDIADLGLRS